MNARNLTRAAATATLGLSALGLAGQATAADATTSSSKTTAFTTADGKIACAYDQRDHHTKCVNTTSGWKGMPGTGNLRDVDGNLIADHPFVLDIDPKSDPNKGLAAAGVSTQGPGFDTAASQTWHADSGAVKHVRIATNGYGNYVDQGFAVLPQGKTLTFPDGVQFSVDEQNHVNLTTHPTSSSKGFFTITPNGYGASAG